MMDESHWEEADRARFAAAWDAELAEVPGVHREHDPHRHRAAVADLEAAAEQDNRVYRLQTDDGERVIGRLVSPGALDGVCRNLGVEGAPALSAMEAWGAVVAGSSTLHLADGLQVRRASVMGAPRVELMGFSDGAVERLKALGCTSEIIAWRLRLFVPVGERGPVTGIPSSTGTRSCASRAERPAPASRPRLRKGGASCPPCPPRPPIWRAGSRSTPRPCAGLTCRTDAAAVDTGASAMAKQSRPEPLRAPARSTLRPGCRGPLG